MPIPALPEGAEPYTVIEMAPAESGSVGYGPLSVHTEDVLYPPIEVAVLDYATLSRQVELPLSYAREFQEPLTSPGVGQFSLMNDDPGLDAITAEVLIGFFLYGQHAMTVRPETIETGYIGQSEEYDENSRITGTQHISLFDEAVVYPPRGPGSEPVWDERAFSWVSVRPDYDDSNWQRARAYTTQAVGNASWADQPRDWPDPGAQWIGPPQWSDNWAPPGVSFYRSPVAGYVVPNDVDQIAVFFTCDNDGELYFEGNMIFSRSGYHLGVESGFYDVMPGKPVQFAAWVRNIPHLGGDTTTVTTSSQKQLVHIVVPGDTLWGLASRFYGSGAKWRVIYDANASIIKSTAIARGRWWPDDPGHWIFPGTPLIIPGFSSPSTSTSTVLKPNPTGLLMTAYKAINGEVVGTSPLFSTNQYWLCVPYPREPPGMTVGRVIRILVQEAQRRGALEGITLDFTDTVDSDGRAWPLVADISTKIGYDYLTVLTKELAETYADFWMHPSDKRLSAWVHGDRGVHISSTLFHGPTDPTNPETSNVSQQSVVRML